MIPPPEGGRGIIMAAEGSERITLLLQRMSAGDESAREKVFQAIHAELHRRARGLLGARSRDHSLQASALVNETYLKLVQHEGVQWESRKHFFCVAAKAMRSVLVDHARGKARRKRVPLEDDSSFSSLVDRFEERATDLLALDRALEALAREDDQAARVVELRFFAGLTAAETARVLDLSVRTVDRDWEFARAWLRDRMS